MQSERILRLLGLCRRAGKLISGQDTVIAAVQSEKAALALLSSDASERTKKQLRDKCTFHGVPLVSLTVDGGALGKATGKAGTLSSLAVTDRGFASSILKMAEED